jgi:preprotein translocase subunit SecF
LIPLSSCAFNVSCLFNGLVYYNQWSRLYWWQLFIVMIGVTITISGVLLLSWRAGWGVQVQEETVVQQEYNNHHLPQESHYAAIVNPGNHLNDEGGGGNEPGSSNRSEISSSATPRSTEKTPLLSKKQLSD